MTTISMGVYVYKMVDGIADVYEGRLQQADKLYLAGISQAMRSVAAAAVFSRRAVPNTQPRRRLGRHGGRRRGVARACSASRWRCSRRRSRGRRGSSEVAGLLSGCFPLFAALFLFNLIESMPKFVMEGMLPYDNQLYFNALYFPAQGILSPSASSTSPSCCAWRASGPTPASAAASIWSWWP